MSYIERAITSTLKKRVKESKCTLVTGARQIGKSTLIKHEFPEYNRANFDDRLTRLQAKDEYYDAMKSQFRQTGNHLTGTEKSSIVSASLLA